MTTMTTDYPWYGLAEGEMLEQGHFLRRCPNVQVQGAQPISEESDVIVISHTCDLANEKLAIVQVCPYLGLEELAAEYELLRSKKGREELRRGSIPGLHLLNRCSLPGFEHDFLVCDFRAVFGVRTTVVRTMAAQQSPRLRLLPPYREHLAQAFARFFMPVGLPVDVPPFR